MPWWHEKQVTWRWPRKLFVDFVLHGDHLARGLLGALVVRFRLSGNVTEVAVTPSELAMNCIAGCNWSAGVPLSAVMFLKTCSAVFGSGAWA